MKQRISMTIETTIQVDSVEVSQAVERLGVKVNSITVGRPYDRNPERDGER